MFAALIFALFTFSILKIEIECSVIRRENLLTEAEDSTELPKNLPSLKKIEDLLIRSKSTPPSQMKNEKLKPHADVDNLNFSTASKIEEKNRIPFPNRKNLLSKDNVGHRKPKFLGSLAFLTGLGAGSLATAASVNANAFVKLLSAPVPIPIGAPGYFTGFYEPQPYLPLSYPVFYPVPRVANYYQNLGNGIPVKNFSPLPQQISNDTAGKSPDKSGTDFEKNEGTTKRPENEKTQVVTEATTIQADSKRAVAEEVDEDNVQSPAMNEETELRQSDTTQTTTTSTTTTTIEPVTSNTTQTSNITVPTTSPTNTTENLPFYGYYGGAPQDVGHVFLTTEDPQQRYLKDYTEDRFALPFERPAVFNPYQNVETYPSSFVNSFSPGEPYPEFLNTIESDRYVYDSENRRNFNGFRPILK